MRRKRTMRSYKWKMYLQTRFHWRKLSRRSVSALLQGILSHREFQAVFKEDLERIAKNFVCVKILLRVIEPQASMVHVFFVTDDQLIRHCK